VTWPALRPWLGRAIVVAIVVLLLVFVVLPQMSDAVGALRSLGGISAPLLGLALAFELSAIASYSMLTRSVLSPEGRPSYVTLLRIDVADFGVTNVVPGGGVTALAARYRLLTLAGVRPPEVVSSAVVEVTTSTLMLGGIFGTGILLSLTSFRGSPYYLLAGTIIFVILVTAVTGLVLLRRHRDRGRRIVHGIGRRLPGLSADAVVGFVGTMARQLQDFARDRRRLATAVWWASANWLLDASALWTFLLAFGYLLDPGHLLLAYGLATILGLLPITPGGLGIVEGILLPTLVSVGAPYSIAVLGVVAWRLVQYWMPIPLACLAYLSLRLGVLRTGRDAVSYRRLTAE
jgi:uncharacterized protein (TIRG00374 family)